MKKKKTSHQSTNSRSRSDVGKKKSSQSGLSSNMRHRLNEGLLILVAAVCIYFLLALLTYHQADPSWAATGSETNGAVANAGGRIGAQISGVLLSLFGYPAYIFPILVIILAWVLYRHQWYEGKYPNFHAISALLLLFGFVMTLAAACGLGELFLPLNNHLLPMTAGGMIGSSLLSLLGNTLNKVGSSLILLSLFLIGFTLFSGVSWVYLSKQLLRFIAYMATQLKRGIGSLLAVLGQWLNSAWQKRKERKAEQKQHQLRQHQDQHRSQQYHAAKAGVSATPKINLPSNLSPPSPATAITATNEPPSLKAPEPKMSLVKSNRSSISKSISNELPAVDLLDEVSHNEQAYHSTEKLEAISEHLREHLAHFGIDSNVVGVEPGPVVTRFEVELAPGMKVSRVSNIDKDLARSMSTASVRVVEVIPGKPYIGIEVPNEYRDVVNLKELLVSDVYRQSDSPLTMALGKNISGQPVTVDLQQMPHLLVAGTTGSGKSVSLNAMVLSMLFKSSLKDLRLIMIDPKMLELSIYKDIPHLLAPVVTDMKDANNALRWCIAEMERRYRLMAKLGVRNLVGLNQKIDAAESNGSPIMNPLVNDDQEPEPLNHFPFIVMVIDELADLMMVVGKKIEQPIARIAQKARAAGIHMILATQRPSVDVITGLIKANIPSRCAFRVSSRVDSRTILDQQGAQQLLGYGDMLFLPSGSSVPMRVHGPFVSDEEIHRVADALRQSGEPEYVDAILSDEVDESLMVVGAEGGDNAEADALYDQAVAIVIETRRASISLVQRRLRIGYNRAANLLEAMEAAGLVSSMQANGSREVLVPGEGDR